MRSACWLHVILLSVLVVTTTNLAYADPNGHFTVTANGPPITGDLTNAVLSRSTVNMIMVIDQNLPTNIGPVNLVGNGLWSGTMSNLTLSGTISNVQGSAKACLFIFCQEASFTGEGTWNGTLNASASGSGTFQGTLTFTGSPLAPSGPVPISGTWESTFQE